MPKVPACKTIEGKPTHKVLLMQSTLQQNATFVKLAEEQKLEYQTSEVTVGYDNFNYQDALK